MWGQVHSAWQQTHIIKDHPHACGDKDRLRNYFVNGAGSSPRVWGQAMSSFSDLHKHGIIPTRVGTRSMIPVPASAKRDHPHACGDKTWSANTIFGIVGSSPRVWGQAYFNVLKTAYIRIIPTRVGTRIASASSTDKGWDHPHACGDKLCALSCLCRALGSSPRVWGQDKVEFLGHIKLRIIPTRVGTS